MIVSLSEYPTLAEQACELLRQTGDLVSEPLSQRVDIDDYFEKLKRLATVKLYIEQGIPLGIIAYYANDTKGQNAYLSWIGIKNGFSGQGVAGVLLDNMHADCQHRGMKSISLEVSPDNTSALCLYRKHGYETIGLRFGKPQMSRTLPQTYQFTRIDTADWFVKRNIELRIKRDDLFPMSGGGNKSRKIGYIVRSAIANGHKSLVTNGGLQSNHCRAAAIACAEAGLPCRLVLHSAVRTKDPPTGNLLLMQLAGAEIEFCEKRHLAQRMDAAVSDWTKKGLKPLYVWGGGHCIEGSLAYLDAAYEAQLQCRGWIPDFLVVPSGTGTTQAGLTVGYARLPTKVIGVSVAREQKSGQKVIDAAIRDLWDNLDLQSLPPVTMFRDDWVCGGYEQADNQVINTIQISGRRGLVLDSTYTGKAMVGLSQMIASGLIPERSRVLFWHTGGLLNLLAAKQAFVVPAKAKEAF